MRADVEAIKISQKSSHFSYLLAIKVIKKGGGVGRVRGRGREAKEGKREGRGFTNGEEGEREVNEREEGGKEG